MLLIRSLLFLCLLVNLAQADSYQLKAFTLFSDGSFENARWLTMATYDHQGFTIDFPHRAQIVRGPADEFYIVDHFSHRQDRLLRLSVGDSAAAKVVDLTGKLGITLKNDDIVNLKIVSADPLVVRIHIEPHHAGEADRELSVKISPEEMSAGKDLQKSISFPNWVTSFSLWSGRGFFDN